MTSEPLSLRVLTFNTGLLKLQLGPWVVDEIPYGEQRVAGLVGAIGRSGADVVCLQEVFSSAHFSTLADGLAATYPYSARHANGRRFNLGLGHGLAIFSTMPIVRSYFTPFSAGPWLDKIIVARGFITVDVALSSAVEVRVVDLHTTAGGRQGTDTAVTNALREQQLRQVDSVLTARPSIVCGDFNAGPEASAENYEAVLARGYADAGLLGAGADGPGCTWRPDNPLIAGGRFRDSPPQRIDHVFLDPRAHSFFDVRSSATVFADPIVPLPAGAIPLSDHAGLLVSLVERRSDREQGTVPEG